MNVGDKVEFCGRGAPWAKQLRWTVDAKSPEAFSETRIIWVGRDGYPLVSIIAKNEDIRPWNRKKSAHRT